MASPTILTALDDLQLLQGFYPDHAAYLFTILMHKLRSLRTFLLCSRKLNNRVQLRTESSISQKDRSLGSLLVRVEDVLSRNQNHIHSCLGLEDEGPIEVRNKVTNFLLDIESFEEEIDEWYITLSDYLQQSSSPTTNQAKEIANSVLENLEDFLSYHRAYIGFLVEPIDALIGNITFLRDFIRFVTLRSADHQEIQDFLTHIEALAINAAHLTVHLFSTGPYSVEVFSVRVRNLNRNISYDGLKFMISALLEKMKPTDPCAYETYTRALSSLKYSRELNVPTLNMNDDPMIVMKDFICFLLSDLWEMLQADAGPVVLLRDQLQALYEGLRSLRTILEKHPNMVDDRIRDLIGVVMCDAGVAIFSLYQKDIIIDLGLPDLLENIKVIRTEAEGKVAIKSEFSFPKINVLGFLDFLLDNLMEVKSCKVEFGTESLVQAVGENLVFLKSFLGVLVQLRNQHEDLQVLWERAVEMAYKIEPLIDQLVLGDIQDSFSTSFESIKEDIWIMKTDALKIFHGRRQDIKIQKVSWTSGQVPSQSRTLAADEVVGFETETASIINRLTGGSTKLQVVSIVGMPGSGKTTLARKVYNDPSVIHHFHVRAWCSISQVFNRKKVLLELLNQTVEKLPDGYLDMTENDLVQKLWRSLRRRRYLISVDDIWDIQAFNHLKESLPDDSTESRILLTSRHWDVAPEAIIDEEPHFLRQLTGNESLELLQRKLFPGQGWPPSLYEFGMQIAGKCKGLPLAIVIVAGMLSTTKQELWNQTLECLNSGIISGTEQCENIIEMSYRYLPEHLKPCLLSFGAFPEDQEVSIKRLIWLWSAEGFVRKTNLKGLEEVATDNLKNLIRRSLVMGVKKSSRGGVKACCTHDLLHDFCRRKAKEENLFQLLKGYEELLSFNEPGNLRRLCIYSEPKQLKESKLYCPGLRTLLFFNPEAWSGRRVDMSFIVGIVKLLKVLDIEQVNLGFDFPTEIGLLVQLRYLAIQGTANVSASIGNLSNLETFILRSAGTSVILPDTFWNLQKLRHLYLSYARDDFSGIDLPFINLDSSSNLYELDSLSTLSGDYWGIMEKQLRKFPNLRQLKCRLFAYEEDHPDIGSKFMSFSFLSQLESIDVSFFKNFTEFEFVFPESLKKLSLSGCGLPWKRIAAVANLPRLEVLKLLHGSFFGNTWNVEEGEFSKLKFLKLESLYIVNWRASDDQFPQLQKLVLESCGRLEEIPNECLENAPYLEVIEVINCSDSIASVVEQIKDTQVDMGNSAFKVLVHSTKKDTW